MSEIERAMAEGAQRSRAAHRGEPPPEGPPPRLAVWGAHGGWLRIRALDLWQRRKRFIIGLGLFLLFDIIAGIAAVAAGGHF